mgnify:CR=1 FL=1|jgi:hypothetical protein
MSTNLPKGFEALAPLVADWALPTQDARQTKRRESPTEALQTFYDALVPLLPKILEHVDEFPLGELPEDSQRLFYLTLALAEVAPHIELYRGDPNVPHSFEEERFVAAHGEHTG